MSGNTAYGETMKNVISPEQAQSILLEAEEFLLRPVWMTDDGDEYVIEHAEGELARVAHSQEGLSDALLIVTAINKLPELCQTVIDQAKELERFQQVCHVVKGPLSTPDKARLLDELQQLMRLDRRPLIAPIETEAVEERSIGPSMRAFLTDKK